MHLCPCPLFQVSQESPNFRSLPSFSVIYSLTRCSCISINEVLHESHQPRDEHVVCKVALSACASGSSLGSSWEESRIWALKHSSLELGSFFFHGEQKHPMPVCCCPGLPEQLGVLTAPLSILCPYFLKRHRTKRGLWTAPGHCLPCMQCLALLRDTVSYGL